MEYSVTQSCELLDEIRQNRETYTIDVDGKGGVELDHA
jgi:hypothetical protein